MDSWHALSSYQNSQICWLFGFQNLHKRTEDFGNISFDCYDISQVAYITLKRRQSKVTTFLKRRECITYKSPCHNKLIQAQGWHHDDSNDQTMMLVQWEQVVSKTTHLTKHTYIASKNLYRQEAANMMRLQDYSFSVVITRRRFGTQRVGPCTIMFKHRT